MCYIYHIHGRTRKSVWPCVAFEMLAQEWRSYDWYVFDSPIVSNMEKYSHQGFDDRVRLIMGITIPRWSLLREWALRIRCTVGVPFYTGTYNTVLVCPWQERRINQLCNPKNTYRIILSVRGVCLLFVFWIHLSCYNLTVFYIDLLFLRRKLPCVLSPINLRYNIDLQTRTPKWR